MIIDLLLEIHYKPKVLKVLKMKDNNIKDIQPSDDSFYHDTVCDWSENRYNASDDSYEYDGSDIDQENFHYTKVW